MEEEDPYHPLFGHPARIAWLPEGMTATAADFYEPTKASPDRLIELWHSVRDAIKYAMDNPKPGLKPSIMTSGHVFHYAQVKAARVKILEQDHKDGARP